MWLHLQMKLLKVDGQLIGTFRSGSYENSKAKEDLKILMSNKIQLVKVNSCNQSSMRQITCLS